MISYRVSPPVNNPRNSAFRGVQSAPRRAWMILGALSLTAHAGAQSDKNWLNQIGRAAVAVDAIAAKQPEIYMAATRLHLSHMLELTRGDLARAYYAKVVAAARSHRSSEIYNQLMEDLDDQH